MGNKRGAPPKFIDPVTGVRRAASGKERAQAFRDKRKAERMKAKFIDLWHPRTSEFLCEFFDPRNLLRRQRVQMIGTGQSGSP
jgi:hypothetical protein